MRISLNLVLLCLLLFFQVGSVCAQKLDKDSNSEHGARVRRIPPGLVRGMAAPLMSQYQKSPGYLLACKALTELLRGASSSAIRAAGQALQKDNKLAAAYAIRGIAFSEYEQPQKVVDDLSKAFSLDKKWAGLATYDMRRQAYSDLQNWPAAIADTDQAIALAPKEAWRYRERGELYYAWHKNDQALKDYSTVVKLDSKNYDAYKLRGDLLTGMGRYKEAIADYTESLKLCPSNSVAYGCRARCYEKLGQTDLAKKDRERAKNVDLDGIKSDGMEELLGK